MLDGVDDICLVIFAATIEMTWSLVMALTGAFAVEAGVDARATGVEVFVSTGALWSPHFVVCEGGVDARLRLQEIFLSRLAVDRLAIVDRRLL